MHFNKYVTDTETKAGQYRNLLESNKKAAGEIGQYQDNINKYKLENTFWSLKRAQNKRECTERNQALQKELRKL